MGCGLWVGCERAVSRRCDDTVAVAVAATLRRCMHAAGFWVLGFGVFGFWGFWFFGFLVFGVSGFGVSGFWFWGLGLWRFGIQGFRFGAYSIQYLESVRVELIAEIWKYCTVLYHLKVE